MKLTYAQCSIEKWIRENFALLAILVGSLLISISLGPYSSWDSQLEFSAAKGVVEWGLPYTEFGHLMNQPPLGFYTLAVFLKTFGVTYETAEWVTTVLALGSVFLTYKIGETLYGKRTGLFAAALFALTPWQVIMSSVFLIDIQCLFLSLLFLLVGIYAIRRNSLKLYVATGVIFGLALLTKVFAVFMLVPLALLYFYSKPKDARQIAGNMFSFVSPAFLMQYMWYDIVSGRGLLSVFAHEDFAAFLPAEFNPSPFFHWIFFSEALGIFFLVGLALSVAVSLMYRKQLSKLLRIDFTLLATVIIVMGLSFYLVFAKNLQVPYVNTIKYNYLVLPLICLLAASAAKKCSVISKDREAGGERHELFAYLAAIGPYLLLVAMIVNFLSLTTMLKYSWLTFNVPGGMSYSFDRLEQAFDSSYLWGIQIVGFVLINLGLLWSNRSKLQALFKAL